MLKSLWIAVQVAQLTVTVAMVVYLSSDVGYLWRSLHESVLWAAVHVCGVKP